MSRCRSIAAAVVVLGLAGLLVVGPTASASASASAAASAAAVPATPTVTPGGDFVPSGNKARQYIINTLGSVLKGATPNKWKREVIANQSQYNYGWETLAAELGTDAPKNGAYRKSPNTYTDAILNGIEKATDGKTGPGSRLGNRAQQMFKVPSSKLGKVVKTANGVGAVMIGAELGQWAGRGISEMQGLSPEGITCGGERFLGVDWDSALVGADCDTYLNFQADYAANAGIVAGTTGGLSCSAGVSPAYCIQLIGSILKLCSVEAPTYCVNVAVFNNPANGYMYWSFKSAPESYASGYGEWSGNLNYMGGSEFIKQAVKARYGPDVRFLTYDLRPTLDPANPFRNIAKYKAANSVSPGVAQEANLDPERQLVCEILGTNGVTYKKSSAAYRESAGALPDADCAPLPDGVFPADQWLYDTVDGKSKPIWAQPSTPEFLNWATQFGQCDTGSCPLFLFKVQGAQTVNCNELAEACRDWFDEPTKLDSYKCQYGGQWVALSECNIYSGTFKPERIAIGAPYSDPETGLWSGGSNSPKPGEATMGSAVADPTTSRNCWADGWAEFNPAEWILTPVKCALEWAFVPRPAVLELSAQQVAAEWSSTAPGVVIAAVTGWKLVFNVNGCGGLRFPFKYQQAEVDIGIPSACPGTQLADFANTVRVIGSLGIVMMSAVTIRRLAASSIGFNRGA